jgi:SAM-dependent methyltransferase
MTLPFSDACERNKGPILEVLRTAFADCRHVLEIGSGTGQHAVHFATAMPGVVWQPSELPDAMPALRKRIFSEGPKNLRAPVTIDVTQPPWDVRKVDGIFTANTLHIMHWPQVEAFFAGLPAVAKPGAVLAIYGPFRFRGEHTSGSNESFDAMLRARDPGSGVRDFEAVDALARGAGFEFVADHPMPANNRTLVWKSGAVAPGQDPRQ